MRIGNYINPIITIIALSLAIFLLMVASHTDNWWIILAAAWGFAFIGNTLFAMMHEAVHDQAHSHTPTNDFIGLLCAPFFPTSFSAQKHFHLGHHERNRSAVESWDCFLPDDNRLMKRIQWYSIAIGWYWTAAPAFCLFFLFCAPILNLRLVRGSATVIQRLGADAMLSGLQHHGRIRLEIIWALAVHTALWYFCEVTIVGYACCYAFFAWMWSSLQYADHAFTPRDTIHGAWNLRVLPWTRWLFLQYHHHLAHHQHPHLPWYQLPQAIDTQRTHPWFWHVYLKMWLGPYEVEAVDTGSIIPHDVANKQVS